MQDSPLSKSISTLIFLQKLAKIWQNTRKWCGGLWLISYNSLIPVNHYNSIGANPNVYCVLCGTMTPKQKDFAKLQASSTQESSYIFSTGAPRSRYCSLAYLVDDLGYRNILEGRIPKMFYDVRSADIQRRGLCKHAGHWCNGLILRLLQITHRQWTFRCGTVHLRRPDGLTSSQRDCLACKCEELLWTDPTTLLDEDRYLLNINFEALGDTSSSTWQAWLSEMEDARCVTFQNDDIHLKCKKCHVERVTI